MNYNRGRILEMMITVDRDARDAIERDIEAHSKIDDSLVAAIAKLEPNSALQGRVAELGGLRTEYHRVRKEEISLIDSGKLDEAKRLGKGEQEERYERIIALVAELEAMAIGDAKRQLAADMQETRNVVLYFIGIGIVAFALEALIVRALNKSIAKPLGEINTLAEAIASGDLSRGPTVAARNDEIGILARTFSRMTRYAWTIF